MNTSTNDQILEGFEADGILMLSNAGYPQGSYNPHNHRAWIIGTLEKLILALGDCEQDALDNAVDDGCLDHLLMSEEDHKEYDLKGWYDSFCYLGNASEPFWSEYLTIRVIATTNQ